MPGHHLELVDQDVEAVSSLSGVGRGQHSDQAGVIVQAIEGSCRVDELAAMLGSKQAGQPMVDGADRLLNNAQHWKEQSRATVAA